MKNPFRYFKTSPEIIRLAVRMYVRFPLSLRNVEDLLHERGIEVSHETIRFWWNRFGPIFAAEIRKKRMDRMRALSGCRWHLDEMFVKINGEGHYLWRAVDQEGEVLEAFISKKRDREAALKFLRKLMKRYGRPDAIITDRLRSYRAALRELGGSGLQQAGHASRRLQPSGGGGSGENGCGADPLIESASVGNGPWTSSHLQGLWPVSGDQRDWDTPWPHPIILRPMARLNATIVPVRSASTSLSGRRPGTWSLRSRPSSTTTTPSAITRPWARSHLMMCTSEDAILSTQRKEEKRSYACPSAGNQC